MHLSLLGIPHDLNSLFLKGTAEAQRHIREAFHSDAHSRTMVKTHGIVARALA